MLFAAKISGDYFVSKYFGLGAYVSYFASEHADRSCSDITSRRSNGLKPRLPIEDTFGSVDLLVTPGLRSAPAAMPRGCRRPVRSGNAGPCALSRGDGSSC
jgi:hypothetical protein